MAKQNKRRSDTEIPELEFRNPAIVSVPQDQPPPSWSGPRRTVASVLILIYLAIVLLGPLSNPIASRHFSAPVAAIVAPIHRMLFLGHGYRFFAPDPGPSHRLVYRGLRADGTEFSGHFPDRSSNWPRLLYHRWFMLSETLFNENLLRPTARQLEERNLEYEREIERYRAAGKLELGQQLSRERDLETMAAQRADQRIKILATGISEVLLKRNEGQSVELFVQEREIPFPEQVASGIRLDDQRYLSELVKIGELDSSGFHAASPQTVTVTGAPK